MAVGAGVLLIPVTGGTGGGLRLRLAEGGGVDAARRNSAARVVRGFGVGGLRGGGVGGGAAMDGARWW